MQGKIEKEKKSIKLLKNMANKEYTIARVYKIIINTKNLNTKNRDKEEAWLKNLFFNLKIKTPTLNLWLGQLGGFTLEEFCKLETQTTLKEAFGDNFYTKGYFNFNFDLTGEVSKESIIEAMRKPGTTKETVAGTLGISWKCLQHRIQELENTQTKRRFSFKGLLEFLDNTKNNIDHIRDHHELSSNSISKLKKLKLRQILRKYIENDQNEYKTAKDLDISIADLREYLGQFIGENEEPLSLKALVTLFPSLPDYDSCPLHFLTSNNAEASSADNVSESSSPAQAAASSSCSSKRKAEDELAQTDESTDMSFQVLQESDSITTSQSSLQVELSASAAMVLFDAKMTDVFRDQSKFGKNTPTFFAPQILKNNSDTNENSSHLEDLSSIENLLNFDS